MYINASTHPQQLMDVAPEATLSFLVLDSRVMTGVGR